jgi:hypothetical protein
MRNYPEICLKGLRKNTENLIRIASIKENHKIFNQDSWSLGQDFNSSELLNMKQKSYLIHSMNFKPPS